MRALLMKATVAVVVLASAGGLSAQDERKGFDGQVYKTLREVINRGADMYNSGDYAGCYRLFEGALITVKPLLDHRPDVQKSIDRGLDSASRSPDMRRRAWALRTTLDDVRSAVSDGKAGAVAKGNGNGGGKRSLWDRLGGEAGVRKVVDDFTALAAGDEKVNFFRDGKYKPTEEQVGMLKNSLVALISATTGGPLKYTGKSMKEVHKGMGITNEEFDALANDLVKALTKNGAAADDIDALLKIVDSTRGDIVEVADEPKLKPKDKKEEMKKEEMKDDEDKPKKKDEKKDDDEKKKDDAKDDEKKKDDAKDEKKDEEKKKDE